MRSIQLFGIETTHWQVLPVDAPDFEEAALRACARIIARDARIGKVPKRRTISRARAEKFIKRPKARSPKKSRK
jgi:hypothetical protein